MTSPSDPYRSPGDMSTICKSGLYLLLTTRVAVSARSTLAKALHADRYVPIVWGRTVSTTANMNTLQPVYSTAQRDAIAGVLMLLPICWTYEHGWYVDFDGTMTLQDTSAICKENRRLFKAYLGAHHPELLKAYLRDDD